MLHKIIPGALIALLLAGCSQKPLLHSGQLLYDVKVLAADSLEGRASTTAGNYKARTYLIKRFSEIGLQPYNNSYEQHFTIKRRTSEGQGTNLVGYIPGNSGKSIVITAHYDHVGVRNDEIYNGADDNASGVAAMLAVAVYFKENPPQHTLIFVAPDAEEMGLQGAGAFLDNPPVPLDDILLNVNLDMLSINSRGELYTSGVYHYPGLKELVEKVKPQANARLLTGHDHPDQGRDDWTNQSDHYQFHKRGIPFLYFGVEDHPHYHRPTDDFEQINQAFYADAVTLVIDFLKVADKSLNQRPASR